MTALSELSERISATLGRDRDDVEVRLVPMHGDLALSVRLSDGDATDPDLLAALRGIKDVAEVHAGSDGAALIRPTQAFWTAVPANAEIDPSLRPRGDGRMVVECVSAYPTGPLRTEHYVAAVLGDVMARVYERLGWQVTREFYVNDLGQQMQTHLRVLQALAHSDEGSVWPEMAPELDQYLDTLVTAVRDRFGAGIFTTPEAQWLDPVKAFTVAWTLDQFATALTSVDMRFDQFVHESEIRQRYQAEDILAVLRRADAVHEDPESPGTQMLSLPGSVSKKDLILLSSQWSWTYLMSDVALQLDRLRRGFDGLTILLNADHRGYARTLRALAEVLGKDRPPFVRARSLRPVPPDLALSADAEPRLRRWQCLMAAVGAHEDESATPPQTSRKDDLTRLLALWPDLLAQVVRDVQPELLAVFAKRLADVIRDLPDTGDGDQSRLRDGEKLLSDLCDLIGVNADCLRHPQPSPAVQGN